MAIVNLAYHFYRLMQDDGVDNVVEYVNEDNGEDHNDDDDDDDQNQVMRHQQGSLQCCSQLFSFAALAEVSLRSLLGWSS